MSARERGVPEYGVPEHGAPERGSPPLGARSRPLLPRRRAALIVALLLVALLGVVIGSTQSQSAAPRMFVEVSGASVPLAGSGDEVDGTRYLAVVGEPLDVSVAVDVPSFLRLRYADIAIDEVAQELHASLLPEPGEVALIVEAENASGQVARHEVVVTSAWPPQPRLAVVDSLTVGEALTVRLSWEGTPEPRLAVREAYLELAGTRLAALERADELLALVPLPLQSEPGERPLRGVVVDERGVAHVQDAVVIVSANPNPVQELRVSATTLSVVTPEARALEADALERAFDAVGPSPRWSEPFVLPLVGRDTSAFGLPRRYAPGGPVSFHLGTDIAAPTGTPIVATNDGVVRIAGMYPIKGGLVVIDHGFGVTSLYFHQSTIAVAEGDVVERGQVIGTVGSTGLSTGPHLHWEMRVDGVPTAPLAWVGRVWPGAPLEAVGGE